MIKCEYEKDFQSFAQHMCQNWRKSYVPEINLASCHSDFGCLLKRTESFLF